MVWWLWLLIGISIPIVLLFLYVIFYSIFYVKKYGSLSLFCNNCKHAFNDTYYKYCPYCSSKLSHHKEYLNYLKRNAVLRYEKGFECKNSLEE